MRVHNWQERFWEALRAAHSRKFVWGEHDCVLFAVRVLDAINEGSQLERRVKTLHPYRCARAAAEHIKSAGSLKKLAISYFGEPIAPNGLGIGDVALFDQFGAETLGIHDGVNVLGPGIAKLERVDPRAVICGWKVL